MYITMLVVKCISSHSVLILFAAHYGSDFSFITGTKLHFTEIETFQSFSKNQVLLSIVNDDIAEPCESFICTLQQGVGALYAVRSIVPNHVTVRICDDDSEHNLHVN